jgi:hypothetical protein
MQLHIHSTSSVLSPPFVEAEFGGHVFKAQKDKNLDEKPQIKSLRLLSFLSNVCD